MTDVLKQINYWINGADEDAITARILIQEGRFLHGLFFCHLVIEKALKAHFVKKNGTDAPRTHNLIFLSEQAGLELDEKYQIFIGILMRYQLQGRYPDYNPVLPEQEKVNDYLIKTREILQWLKMKL